MWPRGNDNFRGFPQTFPFQPNRVPGIVAQQIPQANISMQQPLLPNHQRPPFPVPTAQPLMQNVVNAAFFHIQGGNPQHFQNPLLPPSNFAPIPQQMLYRSMSGQNISHPSNVASFSQQLSYHSTSVQNVHFTRPEVVGCYYNTPSVSSEIVYGSSRSSEPKLETGPHAWPQPPSMTSAAPAKRVISVRSILGENVAEMRPHHIVIILRGLPGSGKSFAARAIKEKELVISSRSPRILSMDEYFMVDPDDAETTSVPSKYEYNAALEKSFRLSLLKSFKKTVDDGLFTFIIVDSYNDKISYFDEFVTHALSKGFAVYIATISTDLELCKLRSQGRRSCEDVDKMARFWEETPQNYVQLDLTPLLNPEINTIEMEDVCEDNKFAPKESSSSRKRKNEVAEAVVDDSDQKKSKWELMEATSEEIDRLDGLPRLKSSVGKHSHGDPKSASALNGSVFSDSGVVIFENVKSDDSASKHSAPSKKHVSWADVEQYKRSLKERSNQFDRMLSEINARSALVKVHLI